MLRCYGLYFSMAFEQKIDLRSFLRLRQPTLGDLAIFVLGINLWVCFLVLPANHLSRPLLSKTSSMILWLAPIVLIAGVYFNQRTLLLALFPFLFIVSIAITPQLVGVDVLSSWTLVLVGLFFLAYMLVTSRMLCTSRFTSLEGRSLGPYNLSLKWRRRFRMYRWMAFLTIVFPSFFIFVLFFHPLIRHEMTLAYPNRVLEAITFFGVLSLSLWLGLFYAYFLVPLRAHVHSDPQVRAELDLLRRHVYRRQPRLRFYIFVGIALAFMLGLFLVRG